MNIDHRNGRPQKNANPGEPNFYVQASFNNNKSKFTGRKNKHK
jgi:hypothetical protein